MKILLYILSILISFSTVDAQTYGRHLTNIWVDSVIAVDSLGTMSYTPANGKVILFGKGTSGFFVKYRSGTTHNLDSAGAASVDTGSGIFIQSGFFGNGD